MFSAFIQDWKTRASIIGYNFWVLSQTKNIWITIESSIFIDIHLFLTASSTSSAEFDKKYKTLCQARQELVKYQALYDKKILQQNHACKLFISVQSNLSSIVTDINEVMRCLTLNLLSYLLNV